jgi:predicted ester cyclase
MAGTLPPFPIPTAKQVIRAMDDIISNHIAVYDWDAWSKAMEPFWTTNLVYDSVAGIGNFTGLHEWFAGEHVAFNKAFDEVVFNQLIFVGEDTSASTTTYGTARWYGSLAGMPPTENVVRIRICDFYRLRGERIAYNWMMLDLPDLLRQAGRRVLPPAPSLPDDGWFQPPQAMDGVPAPFSPLTDPEAREASRARALALLALEWAHEGAKEGESSHLWAPGMRFYGPSGIGYATSYLQYRDHVLGPLRTGLADRRFVLDVLSCEGAYCGAHGYLHGVHSGCLLGEPPTHRPLRYRIALHWHFGPEGLVTDGYLMHDGPALFEQLGVDLLARTETPPACAPPPRAAPPAAAPDSSHFDNECLLSGGDELQPSAEGKPTTFLADCPAWVVRTTDAVWKPDLDAASVNASLEEYFFSGWSSVSSFGIEHHGMAALKELVWRTKRAFPDLRIHVTDVFCTGNDVDGYKTTMPDVLTGTNTGPSAYGPPTGRSFAYNGIAVCYVQKVGGRWQYVSEWVVHDELALVRQLGFDNLSAAVHPPAGASAAPHDCHTNTPTWGWRPSTALDALAASTSTTTTSLLTSRTVLSEGGGATTMTEEEGAEAHGQPLKTLGAITGLLAVVAMVGVAVLRARSPWSAERSGGAEPEEDGSYRAM